MMAQLEAVENGILRSSIAFIVLTFLTSSLRFVIRATSRAAFSADDCWLVASLVTFYACTGILLWGRLRVQMLDNAL